MKDNIAKISKIFYSPKSIWERVRDYEIESSELIQTFLIILGFPFLISLILGIFRPNLAFSSLLKSIITWIIYTVMVIIIFAKFIKDYLDGEGIQFFKIFKPAKWNSLVNYKSLLISIYFITPLMAFHIYNNIFIGRSFVLINTILYFITVAYSLFLLYCCISIVMSETVINPILALSSIIFVSGINIIILSYILDSIGLNFSTGFSQYIFPPQEIIRLILMFFIANPVVFLIINILVILAIIRIIKAVKNREYSRSIVWLLCCFSIYGIYAILFIGIFKWWLLIVIFSPVLWLILNSAIKEGELEYLIKRQSEYSRFERESSIQRTEEGEIFIRFENGVMTERKLKPDDCRKCGGTRWVYGGDMLERYDCPICDGTGKRPTFERFENGETTLRYLAENDCRKCGGAGWVYGGSMYERHICPECNGTGKIR